MIDFTLKTILQFSKRGPEFFRANCDLENNRKIERIVRKIEKKNAKYQRNEEKRKEAKSFWYWTVAVKNLQQFFCIKSPNTKYKNSVLNNSISW